MSCEEKHPEERKMIVMDIKIDNFFAFKNFHMNMAYPKKIVDSYIENEYLEERPNFRYKKVNILMGANATGKTSFGRMLMAIFNFMVKKQYEKLTDNICDESKMASCSVDFVVHKCKLYRVNIKIKPKSGRAYQNSDIDVQIRMVNINKKDSYEMCVERIEKLKEQKCSNYIEELEKIQGLSWMFEYPSDFYGNQRHYTPRNTDKYLDILNRTLKALDPLIEKVEKIEGIDDTYAICMKDKIIVMQEGKVIDKDILSSGTRAGIEVAGVLTAMIEGECGFYYCDEKFSFIHSDIEKAFLAVMIQCMKEEDQLFFTTHNTDILDLPLPKHTFTFLRKDCRNKTQPIQNICASDYLKRNTDSLRNAVENDLFLAGPAVELIYEIAEL